MLPSSDTSPGLKPHKPQHTLPECCFCRSPDDEKGRLRQTHPKPCRILNQTFLSPPKPQNVIVEVKAKKQAAQEEPEERVYRVADTIRPGFNVLGLGCTG